MTLSSHQSARQGTDEWLTSPEIIAALGPFDLDPCSPGARRPWDTAARHFSSEDDGLSQPWVGRVWLNPPFGRAALPWMRRMVRHGRGVALLPARTETALFFECVWSAASAVLFLRGRPHFHYVDGRRASANSGAPICLISYGEDDARALFASGLAGYCTRIDTAANSGHPIRHVPTD